MRSVRNAAAARATLESLLRFGIRLDLTRMRSLMRTLGDPQASLAAVHIVGTNGKSSTTRMCAAALGASGLRVGAYLSPHIVSLEERVQVDGVPISSERFDRLTSRVLDAADDVAQELGEGPTQFEVLTAIAFLAFGEADVDAVCLEAGLGGRLDATNVLDARVVGLTNIGLDHTALLGDTPEQILGEKIAVVSAGAVVVLGELSDALVELATREARSRGARSVLRVAPGGSRDRGRPPGRRLPAPERGARRRLRPCLSGSASARRPGGAARDRDGGTAGSPRAASWTAARAARRRAQPARDARARRRAGRDARQPAPTCGARRVAGRQGRSRDPRPARAARRSSDRDLERRAGSARSRGGRGARARGRCAGRGAGRHRAGTRGRALGGRPGGRCRDLRHPLSALAISRARNGRDRLWVARCSAPCSCSS